jgi:trehalose 6-phosphate synthase/phosphatase
MGPVEKEKRHETLYRAVTTHTSHSWAASLLKLLLAQMGNELTAHQTPYLDHSLIKTAYHGAKKRLFLFDYDVSLICIAPLGLAQLVVTGYPYANSENPKHGRAF